MGGLLAISAGYDVEDLRDRKDGRHRFFLVVATDSAEAACSDADVLATFKTRVHRLPAATANCFPISCNASTSVLYLPGVADLVISVSAELHPAGAEGSGEIAARQALPGQCERSDVFGNDRLDRNPDVVDVHHRSREAKYSNATSKTRPNTAFSSTNLGASLIA